MAEVAVPVSSEASSGLVRAGVIVGLLALGGTLLWHLVELLAFALEEIRNPYGLDYGEGIVWQQMRLMFTDRAYGPIDGFPAIVFHYPPVYHAMTLAVAEFTGMDQLAAGRTVSLISLLVAGGFGGAIIFHFLRQEGRRAGALVGACVAALAMLSSWPVLFWTPVMRVDMLALAFTFGGTYFALLALARPRMIYAAAVAFVLAVYTKHSMIAAPAACFGSLLLLRPAVALRGLALATGLGLAALGALAWATDGGFVRHLFLYNINRWHVPRLGLLNLIFFVQAACFVALVFALKSRLPLLAAKMRRPHRRGALGERLSGAPTLEMLIVLLAYLTAATLMLVMMAKSGANYNYLIEFFSVVALFAGIAADDAVRLVEKKISVGSATLTLMIPVALAAQYLWLPKNPYDLLPPRKPAAELALLSEMIRQADKPVISDDMVMLIRSGRDVEWETAIFAELAAVGRFDEGPYIAKIERGDFAFFVTTAPRGDPNFDACYNPAVADAIDRAYPRKQELAGFTLHLPPRAYLKPPGKQVTVVAKPMPGGHG